jgi:hypothetical protein
MLILRYDTDIYDFQGCARRGLGVSDLTRLHAEPVPVADWPRRTRELWWSSRLYATVTDNMQELYLRFIHNVLREHTGLPVSIQKRVCFRVQLPATCAHEPTYHRDSTWGQQPQTLNVWIPYVPVAGTNALWVETAPGRSDHRPIDLDYGEALIFAGGPMSHGAVTNTGDSTRVSGDLRYLPSVAMP